MWELLLSIVIALSATTAADERPGAPASMADLPRGESPRVGYVDHGTWRGPDGRTVDVPDRHGISSITAYDGGFLVTDTRYFEGTVGLAQVDGAGRLVDGWTSSGSPAVSGDGRVAWTSFVAPESGQTGPSMVHVGPCLRAWPRAQPFSAVGFIGDDVVVTTWLDVALLDASGQVAHLPRLEFGYDTHGDRVAGRFARGSGVLDVRTGEVLWRARGYGLVFSPSGRRVAMTERDGLVIRRSSDGLALWREELPGNAEGLVWEDERHLLATFVVRRQTAILRLGRDGEVERASSVAQYRPNRPAFVLTTQ